ncbi:MAG: RluA family pseudouridine synthase [Alphaproteobacteria bacterium]|nr:RluA family pseudouridine synthase [Alphaproteobacteria bacterium]
MSDDLPVVYADRWLLVIDKPSGVASQPDQGRTHADVYTALSAQHEHVGLHHRLDRPASGLLVVTLHPSADAPLAAAFRAHAVQRDYLAILAGDALAVGSTLAWSAPLDGRDAHTDGVVLGAGAGMVAVRLSPATGRTHQLRRHAAMAGAPIVGDRRYAGDAGTWLPRLALHATRLRLDHPVTGEPLDLHAPLPPPLDAAWVTAGGS